MNTPDYNLKQLLSMIDTAINAFIENGDDDTAVLKMPAGV